MTSDSAEAIPGADVIITMAPDRTMRSTTTDSAGRYRVIFEQGTGDYLVYVRPVGRQAFRRRVTRDSTESSFTVDAELKPEVQELAEVRIEARPRRPPREMGLSMGPGTGAAEREFDGFRGAVAPDLQGDLAAMAATLPGISAADGGVSALGLPPDQNTTTFNGLAFGGGGLPRGMSSVTRVGSSTYDPARGGFGGIETAIVLRPGGFLTNRRANVALDAPHLQATDPVGARAGQRRTSADLNLVSDGHLLFERWFFNSGVRFTRARTDAVSLLDADPTVLYATGISPDSADRFRSLVALAGVPVGQPFAASLVTENVALAGRIDRPMMDYSTFTPLPSTWGVSGYAGRSRRSRLSMSPTAPPSHAGRSETQDLVVQAFYSSYFGKDQLVLNETRTGLTLSRLQSYPYLELPGATVRVVSMLDDGTPGVGWLSFGGNAALHDDSRKLTWQANNETHFYWARRPAHRGKLFAEVRYDDFADRSIPNRFGTFTYHSLADLEANRPVSFTRALAWPERSASRWTGVLAVSDLWRHTTRFRVQYGARLEATGFPSGPAYNADVERVFGVRTDEVPGGVHVSPRAGFTWVYTRRRNTGEGTSFSSLGQFYQAPRGVLRGGIGEFRGTVDPRRVADAAAHTGLPGSALRLACIGDAVPEPEWGLYAANLTTIPSTCADGSTASFSETAPHVRLFDRSFQPPRSWRANLSWSSVLLGMVVSADGIFSLNLNQPSRTDLNFAGVQRFSLPGEGHRPVFVDPASIVPSSGAIATSDARRAAEFGPVLAQRSDLRSYARQLTLIARPDKQWYPTRFVASLGYTLSHVRGQARGFDGAALGDPARIEWARGDFSPRHEFLIQAGMTNTRATITLFGKVSSGIAFTPLVGSDINGDGLVNDRAFIFDPQAAGDPVLAEALQSLLAGASPRVRSCLTGQLGQVAKRNSCEGPWTASLNANIRLQPSVLRTMRIPQRAQVSFNIANPLGGIDRLLHGSNPRGWGNPASPDPVLYFVRGFDPDARAFRYEVNPRFGDTRPRISTLRAPFRVTLDVSLDLGRPYPAQQLDRVMKPGRAGHPGERRTAEDLKKRYQASVPDFYQPIIQQSDSLLLSRSQLEAITEAQAAFRARVDSLWWDLSNYLAGLPDHYSTADALRHQEETIDEAWELSRLEAQRVLPAILTPLQIGMLPYPASMLYNARERLRIRFYLP